MRERLLGASGACSATTEPEARPLEVQWTPASNDRAGGEIRTRDYSRVRAYAVDEVKRTNGQVSFENAVRSQRRIEPDDTWPGSY